MSDTTVLEPRQQRTETVPGHRLLVRLRHGHGALARVACVLNNHRVDRFSYESAEHGLATVEVVVPAAEAERVRARLCRLVGVVAVSV
ncbi:hypothetical protein ACFWUQ_19105 [Streptomyces sp. NPDC058662]|uniref:hypothetical protein n=1 Tax=Streptomyces sp. NPDC058662 TaxID=3346583 RepID=UPI0036566BE9